jgi:hypothetical protein
MPTAEENIALTLKLILAEIKTIAAESKEMADSLQVLADRLFNAGGGGGS